MPANNPSFFKQVWAIARPYWTSEERWKAGGLLAVIIALALGEVYISVLINQWRNDFYNALQNLDKPAFVAAIIRFTWLALLFIAIAVYRLYWNQLLRIRWRRWLTGYYLDKWLNKQNYYRMQLLKSGDNPDQRISEDIEQFVQLALDLSLGLLSAVVTLFSFLGILWGLSGPLDFTLFGTPIHIPAYMVWAALLYAILGTWITVRVGRPLVGLNFDQQRFEADFRFSLVRLRENSESIAFYHGEPQEHVHFRTRFHRVVDNFVRIMKRQKTLGWINYSYSQLATVFPYVVCAPRFFAKEIQLGGLMQTAAAFGEVQQALSYIVDSYFSIARWRSVVQRLSGFEGSIAQAEAARVQITGVSRVNASDNALSANDLTLRLPDGAALLEHINLRIAPGEALLIAGSSGVGKSTLLRALSGLWPFAEGSVAIPAQATLLFVPQKPYLPLGTLREALAYPSAAMPDDGAIQQALALCGLSPLAGRLDEEESWSQILSLGEQQRIAFARLLLSAPGFAFLDEATSALDEAAEAQLYALIKARLPRMALVSVGHRSTLKAWHDKILTLEK